MACRQAAVVELACRKQSFAILADRQLCRRTRGKTPWYCLMTGLSNTPRTARISPSLREYETSTILSERKRSRLAPCQ